LPIIENFANITPVAATMLQ